MAKRIYFESVKKWALTAGIPAGVAGFALLFLYLSMLGAIEITGASGDMICAGTDLDPCIGYVNFTAKEDIFLYPLDYDPWDRNIPFETDKGLRDWKMYRSWGTGWREIDLSKTCTATWCGAPPNSPDNKYSFAFRENREYQIMILAYKHDVRDDVKWSFGPLDPAWIGLENIKTYDGDLRQITVRNKTDSSISRIKLLTNQSIRIPCGPKRIIAELEFDSLEEYQDALGEIGFYNYDSMRKQDSREFIYKYRTIKTIEKNNYSEGKFINTYYEDIWEWKDIGKDIPQGKIIIGIFTDVKCGEHTEWIPTFFSMEIEEWADFEGFTKYEFFDDGPKGPGTDERVYSAAFLAQNYTIGDVGANETFTLRGVTLYGNGTNAIVNVTIWTTNGTGPGTLLSTNSSFVANEDEKPYNVTMPGAAQSPSTIYWLQLSSTEGASSDNFFWGFNTTGNDYTGGNMYGISGGVATDQGKDAFFEIWGNPITPPEVFLNIPIDGANLSSFIGQVEFNCSQTDDVANQNVSLYGNWTGTWHQNLTTDISGTSNSSTFFVNLSDGNFFWNCYGCDSLDNCAFNSTNFTFSNTILPPLGLVDNLTLSGLESNINAEFGSGINVTSFNNNTGSIICVDIDHFDFGVNYSCGTGNLSVMFNITSFRRNYLNDSNTIKNMSFDGPQNRTLFITSHQYDDFLNVTINLSGYIHNATNPTGVKIYINDTLSNNLGLIFNGIISLTELNDSKEIKNISFRGDVTETVFTRIPKSATMSSAIMNLSGFYNDTITWNNTYDDFEDGSINGTLWFNWSDYTPGEDNASVDENVTFGNAITVRTSTVGTGDNKDVLANLTTNLTGMVPLERIQNLTIWGGWEEDTDTGVTIEINYIRFDVLGYPVINLSGDTQTAAANYTWQFKRNYSDRTTFDYYKNGIYQTNFVPINNEIDVKMRTKLSNRDITNWVRFDHVEIQEYPYPEDTGLEVGIVDGVQEWNWVGVFNITDNRTTDFNGSIDTYLDTCSADIDGYCDVPFYFTVTKGGVIQVNAIEINYSAVVNPIVLNVDLIRAFFGNSTNFADIPIKFESTKNGTLQIEDIRWDYAGGNKTIEILAHNTDYSFNITYNTTFFFSKWDFNLPRFVSYLEFIPSTPSSKNVSAYGQSDNSPIFNFTMMNYGGRNMNFSWYLNESQGDSCVNLTISTNSTKAAGFQLANQTWTDLYIDLEYLNQSKIWMWADYQCTGSSWSWWFPDIYVRGCCTDCHVCSEDLE